MGLKIMPPDVNQSDIRWKGSGKTIRTGFLSVSNLSANTQQRIIEKRKLGPYGSLSDFLERVRPDDPEARSLIHAGAFDSLQRQEARATLLWELAAWQKSRTLRSGKTDLFNSGARLAIAKPEFPLENERLRLRHEFAALGFLCDRHPMVLCNGVLENRGIVKARDLKRFVGKPVKIAGLLITGKVVSTKHGEPMEFLTFEDETGLVETTFFPAAYRKFCYMLDRTRPYILTGKVEEDFGALTLTVERVERIRR
jgi:DNA polymerase-3 subunit alpha/error-prone DNA polymerase